MLTTNKNLNYILISTYTSYFALLGLITYTYSVDENHSWKLLIFQSLPLLLVLPGLINTRFRAHSCLCFIILAYFIAYVVEVGSSLREVTDWIGLGLSIIIFIGAMMSSRYLQRLQAGNLQL
jgi:uncharacterized membrane protein